MLAKTHEVASMHGDVQSGYQFASLRPTRIHAQNHLHGNDHNINLKKEMTPVSRLDWLQLQEKLQILQLTNTKSMKEITSLKVLNQRYKCHLEEMEQDNILLHQKIIQQAQHADRLAHAHQAQRGQLQDKCERLARIVNMLEQDVQKLSTQRQSDDQQIQALKQREKQQLAQLDSMARINHHMQLQIDKKKLKVIESEQYWLAKHENTLRQKQLQVEDASSRRDGEGWLKAEMIKEELSVKDRAMQQQNEYINCLLEQVDQMTRCSVS